MPRRVLGELPDLVWCSLLAGVRPQTGGNLALAGSRLFSVLIPVDSIQHLKRAI